LSGELSSVVIDALASYGKDSEKKTKPNKPRNNGGKYGFDDYQEAAIHTHEVEGCRPGDLCTACGQGKYYEGEDRKKLSFQGSTPVQVERHIQKTLRCNRCGHERMNYIRIQKWTPGARSAIIIQKLYGTPWHRLSRIQKLGGVPIAASTLYGQSKIVWEDSARAIVQELYQRAANSRWWFSDDTGNKILSVMAENKLLEESQRRACHTTAICALEGDFKINLYVTTNQYCLENLEKLLEKRQNPEKVVLMTDASNQSIPKGLTKERIDSTLCLGEHGRRKFKDLKLNYPAICHYFLTLIHFLYVNDRACKGLDPVARLAYHQEHSTAIVNAIYAKINQLFEQKEVEPNSDLGRAMKYWLNHREGLTAFLRIEGARLDNNWSERTLKLMALYRKNSLFFKTKESAVVLNDLFSLVSTCEANGINAFEYLTWIQIHWKAVQKNPEHYLPWCFKQDTERIVA